jgi:hypothetical protein
MPNVGDPLRCYAHYEARMMQSQEILHGPGFSAQLELGDSGSSSAIALAGFVGWPMVVSRGEFGARLQVYEVRSLWSRRLTNASGFSVAPSAGMGLLFMHVEPVAVCNGAPGQVSELAAPFWTRSVTAHAGVRLERRYAALSVAIELGAELDFSRVRFTQQRDGRSRDLFTPWWLRPRFGVALGF